MTQVLVAGDTGSGVGELLERIELHEEEAIVDIFGGVRVWSEPDDYKGLFLEIVEGHRRLAVRLSAIEAARLAIRLTRFLLKHLSYTLDGYWKMIEALEEELNNKIREASRTAPVYAGTDELAIQEIDNMVYEIKSVDKKLDRIAMKHDTVHTMIDHIVNVLDKLRETYKLLHII